MFKTIFLKVFFTFIYIGISLFAYSQSDSIINKVKIPHPKDSLLSLNSDTSQANIHSFEAEYEKLNLINYPAKLKPKRLITSLAVEGSAYIASLLLLNYLWYDDYPKTKFHLFNDGQEWMQMNKIGRAMTTSTFSNFCYYSYRWSGMKHRQALMYGCAVGLSYMTAVEVMNGYSSGIGFSVPNMVADIAGVSFFFTQQMLWKRQYMKMKISYHPTQYAHYRSAVLGDNAVERFFKDYNGQTHWLSIGSSLFVPKKSKFPRWLCISFGYGTEGVLGNYNNPELNEAGGHIPEFERYRQFYFSFDVDFSTLKTKSKFVRLLLLAVNAIKIPFPALEYNTKGQFKFHYMYF